MNRLIFIIISILIFNIGILQTKDLLFKPLIANPIESRVGAFYQFENDKLRLDIGNSFDLADIYNNDSTEIRVGADFMTFTRLRSEGRMKFPVETTDYYFGLNTSFKTSLFCKEFYVRLRLGHISAHLIDGWYDIKNSEIEIPVYSQEFVDLVVAVNLDDIRFYFGGNLVFSTIPDNINIFSPQIGFDYDKPINNNISLSMGLDLKLLGQNNNYNQAISFQGGFNFKTNRNLSVFFGYYFYKGQSIHGMFYDENDIYNGLGFQFNF